MPDNGDDPLSSEDLIRQARERLERAEKEAPPTEDPTEDEAAPPVPMPDQSIEEREEVVGEEEDATSGDRDSGTPTPPVLPSESRPVPWYRRGWVRGLGGGVVALGFFLFNSGVFDPPLEEQLLEAFEEGAKEGGLSESGWECIEDGLRADGYVDELAELDEADLEEIGDVSPGTPLSELPPEFEHFMEGFFFYAFDPSVGCLSASEMSVLEGAADFSDPESVAITELLTAGCQGGSLADCDMLYPITEVGSSAETVALTCGGRNQPLDSNLTTCIIDYQSDPDYQVLVDECGTGFHLACDALFTVSEVGSEDEALGASCGGQRDPEYVLPCFVAYGYGTRG